jgi:dienelactone hydrolase
MDAILTIPVLSGSFPPIVYILAIALAAYLILRPPTKVGILASAIGLLVGFLTAFIVYIQSNLTNAFGEQLPIEVLWWSVAAFGAVGVAIGNLWRTRWWRKAIAVIGIGLFVVAGALGINALYGLNTTVAEVIGVTVVHPISLPKAARSGGGSAAWVPGHGSPYAGWQAPAGMATEGEQGTVVIPATLSGFHARPAGLYLPPAALVTDAPPLPLIILMMGYPGHPGPAPVSKVMDAFQATHHGLAPIVLVADQIGGKGDPACTDSTRYGKAQTYVTRDVVNWARSHLHIVQDPRYWAIMGYSNGGGCAIKYGALMPKTFGSIVDISGEPFPGSVHPAWVMAHLFDGNKALFEASKPMNIMRDAPADSYAGVHAVFTYGADDRKYGPDAKLVASVARSVGMDVTLTAIPGATHIGRAFTGGVAAGLRVLYPLWGL